MRRIPVGYVVAIGLLLAVAIGFVVVGTQSRQRIESQQSAPRPSSTVPASPSLDLQQEDSQESCEQLVLASLKAPATAEFSAWEVELVGTGQGSGLVWNTYGYVDAQNSFGAQVRSIFKCETRRDKASGRLSTTLASLNQRR